jgi:hypothetical protein
MREHDANLATSTATGVGNILIKYETKGKSSGPNCSYKQSELVVVPTAV